MDELYIFEKDHVLFRQDDKAEYLFIVKTGSVICLRNHQDRMIPLFIAKEGDIIGESSLRLKAKYLYSVIALEKVELISIQSYRLRDVMKQGPQWLQNLLSSMVARFESSSSLIAENRILSPRILSQDEIGEDRLNHFKKLIKNH